MFQLNHDRHVKDNNLELKNYIVEVGVEEVEIRLKRLLAKFEVGDDQTLGRKC